MRLILASSSPYRKELLTRLRTPFTCVNPDLHEEQNPFELPEEFVRRLAQEKAIKGAHNLEDVISIGADTIAVLKDEILGKPQHYDNALAQLNKMSGNTVTFLTGVGVFSTASNQVSSEVVPTTVVFKTLSSTTIEKYLHLEKPFQSSGSFKSETTASALVESIQSTDPSAIIGLPLIVLCKLLLQADYAVL